jgi:hypothetical protein
MHQNRLNFLFVVLVFISCSELFFPKTGVPDSSSLRRSTAEGVKNQLIEAYESQRIELIEDLLADSFQFYVAPSFDSYYSLDYERETRDTSMQYINKDKQYYNYWKKKDELYRTRKIFEHSKSSVFAQRPSISRYRYELSIEGDTTAIEFILSEGILILETDYGDLKYVDVNNQVFLLRKDSEGLWAIRKWYDLSSEESI